MIPDIEVLEPRWKSRLRKAHRLELQAGADLQDRLDIVHKMLREHSITPKMASEERRRASREYDETVRRAQKLANKARREMGLANR